MSSPAADTARRALTLREWAELAEDVPGELVDGVLVEEEAADYLHDLVVGWLIATVGGWALARGGLVAASDAKLGLTDDRGRKPDATVYLAGAERPPARGLVTVPPSEDGRYVHAPAASGGVQRDIPGCPGCPGLELDLDALWALADDLEQNAD